MSSSPPDQRSTSRALALSIMAIFAVALTAVVISTAIAPPVKRGAHAKKRPSNEYFTEAMGTTFRLTIVGGDHAEGLMLARLAFDEVRRIERRMSSWLERSELGQLNSAQGEWRPLSPETHWLLGRALQLTELTEGTFDISWAALKGLWDFKRARVPTHELLTDRLKLVGPEHLTLRPPPPPALINGQPHLVPPPAPLWTQDLSPDDPLWAELSRESTEPATMTEGAQAGAERNAPRARLSEGSRLDLGGIAKGYAIDSASRLLRRLGAKDFLFDGGGDLFAFGASPSGKPWRAGVRHPRQEDIWLTLSLPSGWSVVTSGDYERFFVHEGQRLHHIIDLRTGYPAQASVSVTLLAQEATLADALATGLFVLGPRAGLKLVERLEGVEAIWMTPTGEVVYSSGVSRFSESLPPRWRALTPSQPPSPQSPSPQSPSPQSPSPQLQPKSP